MISIHLRRTGAKKDPHYRVVVTDSRAARDGAFIEILGHYHPRFQPATVVLDVDRTRAWIDKGAQPSDTVKSLLRQVEAGAVDVQQAVSPSRQRDAAKHAEARTKAPQPKAEEPTAEMVAAEAADGDEGAAEAPAEGAVGAEETAESGGEEDK